LFHNANKKRSGITAPFLLALYIIAPFEALYSTGGINDPLLAGEERVTFTAKLYF
jgi:hypothetical protein